MFMGGLYARPYPKLMEIMMKIKILKDCLVAGEHCAKGDVVDVREDDAKYLIASNIAEESEKGKAKKTTVKKVKIIVAKACLIGGKHVSRGDVVNPVADEVSYLLARGHAFTVDSKEGKKLDALFKAEAKS